MMGSALSCRRHSARCVWPGFLIALLTIHAPARAEPAVPLSAAELNCRRLLLEAASALDNEQYPTMAQLATERQRRCPGPESLFLVGVAKSNMLRNALVPREDEPLVREQALRALRGALETAALPAEWLQVAKTWIEYLEPFDTEPARLDATPQSTPKATYLPRAAPPFQPDPSYLGPILIGSVGTGLLAAAIVTVLLGNSRAAELRRVAHVVPDEATLALETRKKIADVRDDVATFRTATTVLLVSGGAAIGTALAWALLTPRPDTTVVSVLIDRHTIGGTLRLSF